MRSRRIIGSSWVLIGLAVLLFILWRTSATGAQAEPVPANGGTGPVMELAPGDLVRARIARFTQTLAITGTLKAERTALVRSNVAANVADVSIREGEAVRRGQVLARLDSTEVQARLQQARHNLESAQAQRDIARRTAENNRALVGQGFISRNALDTANANLAAAQAQADAAQAALEIARKAVADTVLRAPFDGIVSQRFVQPGERVGVDGRVLEVVDLSRIELEAAIPADRILSVPIGARATLQVEGAQGTHEATVVRLNPTTQPGTRSVLAYLSVQQPQGLRQGLFARGEIQLAARETLVLPRGAVRLDRPQAHVLAVQEGRIVAREVRLGLEGRAEGTDVVEILDGLVNGDQVLAGHVGALRPGTRVQWPGAQDDAPQAR